MANTAKQEKRLTHIAGRRWFQKSYGNTYHAATLHFSDGSIEHTGKHYGYGDQYMYTAAEQAQKAGYLPVSDKYENGCDKTPLWQLLKDNGVSYSVSDVARERDL